MDIRLALMTGIDIPIPECQLTVHQPTMKEIALLGENDFFQGVQCLTLNKSMFVQDKNDLGAISNFQIFMTIMTEPEAKDKKKATTRVLQILFPSYKIFMTPKSLIFNIEGGEQILIDEENFDSMQETLKAIFCAKDAAMDQQSFNPANNKAKEIADKIMRGRQKVAEQKGGSNSSIFSQYISTLSIGLHISVEQLVNLTMFQLYDLIERFSLYMNWDIDIRSRLAGAKPDQHPDNWMKNIH